jgi:hypothetical protein
MSVSDNLSNLSTKWEVLAKMRQLEAQGDRSLKVLNIELPRVWAYTCKSGKCLKVLPVDPRRIHAAGSRCDGCELEFRWNGGGVDADDDASYGVDARIERNANCLRLKIEQSKRTFDRCVCNCVNASQGLFVWSCGRILFGEES